MDDIGHRLVKEKKDKIVLQRIITIYNTLWVCGRGRPGNHVAGVTIMLCRPSALRKFCSATPLIAPASSSKRSLRYRSMSVRVAPLPAPNNILAIFRGSNRIFELNLKVFRGLVCKYSHYGSNFDAFLNFQK